MTLTINLTDEEESRLRIMAHREGLDPEALVRRLIEKSAGETARLPKTPAEAVAYWRSNGVLGSYGDPSIDSRELASELRRQAEMRESS